MRVLPVNPSKQPSIRRIVPRLRSPPYLYPIGRANPKPHGRLTGGIPEAWISEVSGKVRLGPLAILTKWMDS